MRAIGLGLLLLIAVAPGADAAGEAAYADAIRSVAARNGLDAGLVRAVIRAESGFDPLAVSPKGAQGLMQLMPATALRLGVRDAFDAVANLEAGARHLRYLLDRYAGDVPLALAAYNAGENAVERHRGVPPFLETREYVRRVLAWAGPSGAPSRPRAALYRFEEADGTVIFSNLPPREAPRR